MLDELCEPYWRNSAETFEQKSFQHWETMLLGIFYFAEFPSRRLPSIQGVIAKNLHIDFSGSVSLFIAQNTFI